MRKHIIKVTTSFLIILTTSNFLKSQTTGFWGTSATPTTTFNSFGIGTSSPIGMGEINYCNDTYFGLTITKEDCGIFNLSPLDFNFPSYDARMEVLQGESSTGTTAFTLPISFNLTGYNSSLVKPMFWARVKNTATAVQNASGSHTSRFLVTPYGRSGFNIENPRATLDIKCLAGYNVPGLIVGRQAIGTTNKTQHFHYVPLLDENGYNQITIRNDQGFFYTDGKGTDGANLNGGFVIAPWANNASNDFGGIRLDAKGNMFVHGSINSTKVKVQVKWWSDFVFENDYKLMPIKDLAIFLKEYKHLPNFPTEKEVLTNGIEVSEMISLQQKQIEELALYIIELEKKINELTQK